MTLEKVLLLLLLRVRGRSRGIGASAVPAAPGPPEHVGVGLSSVPESSGWEVGVRGASAVVAVAGEAPLVSPPVSQEGVAAVGPCRRCPWRCRAPRADLPGRDSH